MPTEHQDSPKQKKPASGPKNGPAKRNRSTKRLSSYRPKARNALYTLAQEYRRRHPQATAADAWRHLVAVAATGAHPIIVAHDPAADVLEYLPDLDRRATRTVARRTFFNQWYRLALDRQ